jgi:predicted nuclease of restriction endonuclease-like (RecB) superfamily
MLSWTHYERLLRVDNSKARYWYMQEAFEQMWSYRTLDRNINTQYYERMLLSQADESVVREMKEKTKPFQIDKLAFIKNPTVLEFMGLPGNSGYVEQDIEKAIIDNIQKFLMELGKGFAFVARQQLIRTEAEDYYVDLVFYNYILKCFVLIDLKMGKIVHQDVGQMDMYVRMYDEMKRGDDHNPTIGIVLCSETDKDIARYSILKGNEQLFASKYKLFLPTEAELRAEIERQKEILNLQLAKKQ